MVILSRPAGPIITGSIYSRWMGDVDLPAGRSRQELESAMRGHIIEEAELVGLYGAR